VAHPQGGNQRRIVVGVDGSASSKAALAWAIRQAKLTGVVVDAVIAWSFPGTYGSPMPVTRVLNVEEIASRVLADAIAEVPGTSAITDTIAEVSGASGPVTIRSKIVEGHPARVLLDESAGADLLVVGSRGYGGFTEALLGSIGQHCVQHATCPVVVIRDSVTGNADGG